MKKATPQHKQRVMHELRAAGSTFYGLLKNESRYLPELIQPSEHIEAIAYGRYPRGSCILVATDRRLLFCDKKPLYTFKDEIMYDSVTGVASSRQGYFARVTLHTRFWDTAVNYVNWRAAEKFVRYIEQRRIEAPGAQHKIEAPPDRPTMRPLNANEVAFLKVRKLGVLSTTDRDGRVHGSVVPYFVELNNIIYFLVGPTTTKARNIFAHHFVALTVFDETTRQTLQLRGTAELEADEVQQKRVLEVLEPAYTSHLSGKIHTSFLVIRLNTTDVRFTDYS